MSHDRTKFVQMKNKSKFSALHKPLTSLGSHLKMHDEANVMHPSFEIDSSCLASIGNP